MDEWLARRRMEEEFGQRQAEIIEAFIKEVHEKLHQAEEDIRLRRGDDETEIRGY